MGLVVNEAMNAGRPVIVSDQVDSATDLVEEGKNGFVYPSGDIAALSGRLKRLLTDRELLSQIGNKSLEKISTWSFEADRSGILNALSAVCTRPSALESCSHG